MEIGDRVRILPSAVKDGIPSRLIGQEGVIKSIDNRWAMVDIPCENKSGGTWAGWAVDLKNVEPYIITIDPRGNLV